VRRRSGFTFVEILVALAVFGAITAVAVPRYRQFKERAYVASLRTELGSLRVAQEAFWAENQVYTADATALDWNGSSRVQLAISMADPAAGYTAIAQHAQLPGAQCATYVGAEATTTASGDIVCTGAASAAGAGVLP
jgi:prepilin-type N-terminal cleavage/methylation domain-containing protein